jgi:hypothetical protein
MDETRLRFPVIIELVLVKKDRTKQKKLEYQFSKTTDLIYDLDLNISCIV